MNGHTQPTRCLHCRTEVYDHAALCPTCEARVDDAQRAEWLDALVQVKRASTRKQRGRR